METSHVEKSQERKCLNQRGRPATILRYAVSQGPRRGRLSDAKVEVAVLGGSGCAREAQPSSAVPTDRSAHRRGRPFRPGLPTAAFRTALVAAALTLLIGGCSSGSDGTTPTSGEVTSLGNSSTTIKAEDAVEEAVLEGWRGYWTVYDEAASRADPDWPRLPEYMTGDALREVRVYLVGLRSQGLVERGDLELRPNVVSVDGAMAVVHDCVTDDGHQYDQAGNLRGQPGAVTRGVEAKLVLQDGKWRVSERPVPRDGVCPA